MKIFSFLADNKPGVLDRIAGFMRRNGWNIEQITAGDTSSADLARVTMKVMTRGVGDDSFKERILTMDHVRDCEIYAPDKHLLRETILLHLPRGTKELPGRVLAEHEAYYILEYTGSPDEVDELVKSAQGVQGMHYTRTGAVMIDR